MTERIIIANWDLCVLTDTDGHLNIYITNLECDVVTEIETGQGDGVGEQLALRFTTDKIEKDYEVYSNN